MKNLLKIILGVLQLKSMELSRKTVDSIIIFFWAISSLRFLFEFAGKLLKNFF